MVFGIVLHVGRHFLLALLLWRVSAALLTWNCTRKRSGRSNVGEDEAWKEEKLSVSGFSVLSFALFVPPDLR
jgi:hypothetical protein